MFPWAGNFILLSKFTFGKQCESHFRNEWLSGNLEIQRETFKKFSETLSDCTKQFFGAYRRNYFRTTFGKVSESAFREYRLHCFTGRLAVHLSRSPFVCVTWLRRPTPLAGWSSKQRYTPYFRLYISYFYYPISFRSCPSVCAPLPWIRIQTHALSFCLNCCPLCWRAVMGEWRSSPPQRSAMSWTPVKPYCSRSSKRPRKENRVSGEISGRNFVTVAGTQKGD